MKIKVDGMGEVTPEKLGRDVERQLTEILRDVKSGNFAGASSKVSDSALSKKLLALKKHSLNESNERMFAIASSITAYFDELKPQIERLFALDMKLGELHRNVGSDIGRKTHTALQRLRQAITKNTFALETSMKKAMKDLPRNISEGDAMRDQYFSVAKSAGLSDSEAAVLQMKALRRANNSRAAYASLLSIVKAFKAAKGQKLRAMSNAIDDYDSLVSIVNESTMAADVQNFDKHFGGKHKFRRVTEKELNALQFIPKQFKGKIENAYLIPKEKLGTEGAVVAKVSVEDGVGQWVVYDEDGIARFGEYSRMRKYLTKSFGRGWRS